MSAPRRVVSPLSRFIQRWTLPFYVSTALLYLVLIPMTLLVFPSTTLILTLIILITGALSAMGTLGDALVAHEQNKTLESIDEDVSD
jgi:hypothetical protein